MKRPELKLGRPRVPDVLADLYYDLRDRRLLPFVVLVVVAIVAVPFLLGGGSEEATETPPSTSPIAALKEAAADSSKLTVVEATPGLRDYRRRLRDRTPTDPFKQRYTKSVLKGAKLNESKSESATKPDSGGGESASTSPTTTESSPAPSGSGGDAPAGGGGSQTGGDGGGSQSSPEAVIYSFGVDVTIVHSSGSEAAGDKQVSKPDLRKRVLPPTSLPSNAKQAVTYMGLSPKTSRPLFLVSTDVTGVFGEGKCAAGSDHCQLIELEKGMPEVFEYGEAGDRYKITVTNVEFIVTGHS